MPTTATTTTAPGTSSRQPGPNQTPGIGRAPDGLTTTGPARTATSRTHNRAGITMLVVAARRFSPTGLTLIRVSALDVPVVSRGA